MRETPLALLLLPYIVCSFSYAFLCGVIGRTYDPLSAFSVYAVGCLVSFIGSALWYRPKRIWPPTRDESLAAVASTLILTSSTLSLLLPQSLLAVVTSKSGALLIPSARHFRLVRQIPLRMLPAYVVRRLSLPLLAILAVVLSAWRKPLVLIAVPFCLACVYVTGYALKLKSVKMAKITLQPRTKNEFVVAEQLVVAVVTLAIAALFDQYRRLVPGSGHAATLADWRLWAVAAASYGGGFIGTQLVLHSTPQTIVFPAYRAASLLCALGASAARGELHWKRAYWSDWSALAVALVVVLWASGAFSFTRKRFAVYSSYFNTHAVTQTLRNAKEWLSVAWDNSMNAEARRRAAVNAALSRWFVDNFTGER